VRRKWGMPEEVWWLSVLLGMAISPILLASTVVVADKAILSSSSYSRQYRAPGGGAPVPGGLLPSSGAASAGLPTPVSGQSGGHGLGAGSSPSAPAQSSGAPLAATSVATPAATVAVTPAPTSTTVAAPRASLPPLDCSNEPDLRSTEGAVVTSVEFTNGSTKPVRVYWLDYSGQASSTRPCLPPPTMSKAPGSLTPGW